jgi:dipeptidyl aminopeptidase/acylaminoacyl peptidase
MNRWFALLVCVATSLVCGGFARSTPGNRVLTVADEIGLAEFGDNSYSGKVEAITWSPDAEAVAVHVARGRLSDNQVESELRIYSAGDLRRLAAHSAEGPVPKPRWSTVQATFKEGPIIQSIRWAADGKSLFFLLKSAAGNMQLAHVDPAGGDIKMLSQEGQDVTGFDARDDAHYVFAVRDQDERAVSLDRNAPAVILSGRPLRDIVFPVAQYPANSRYTDRSHLWAADGGPPALVLDPRSRAPVVIYSEGLSNLRLSPDGHLILTVLPMQDVPGGWTGKYLPPTPGDPHGLKTGLQDLNTLNGTRLMGRYVLVDLIANRIDVPMDSPTGRSAGWWPTATPVWSTQGDAIVLPAAFAPAAGASEADKTPCVVLLDIQTYKTTCIEPLVPDTPEGFAAARRSQTITSLQVRQRHVRDIAIGFVDIAGNTGSRDYAQTASGAWHLASHRARDDTKKGVVLRVVQSVDSPPTLQVYHSEKSKGRIVWDPNPQLSQFSLGPVRHLDWTDAAGRQWQGGLFLPPRYNPAGRYPLVIQTNGFSPEAFRPSGSYPTGYAARALAAVGIAVLQTRCPARPSSAEEGPCQAAGYEAAVEMLEREGLVDPGRVGIIGFSRTCYYVLEALTEGGVRFKAASITDGVNFGYWQYLMEVDANQNAVADESNGIYGDGPFGPGLLRWTAAAPTFNMDRVAAPLQIVGEGLGSVLFMWEPYALLRYQRKPVELELLNTTEHILTTPTVRLASQGGTVDWMRFWLQDYEDPEPSKAEQYARWEKLCDRQIANTPNRQSSCVRTKRH